MKEKMGNTSEQTPKIKHSEAFLSLTELIDKVDLYHEATDDETSKDMELLLREYYEFRDRIRDEITYLKEEISELSSDAFGYRKPSDEEKVKERKLEGRRDGRLEELESIKEILLDKIATDAFREFAKITDILEGRFEEEGDNTIDYDHAPDRFLPTIDVEAVSEEFMIFCEEFGITREELIRKLNAKIEAIRQAELDKHKEQLLNRDDKKTWFTSSKLKRQD